MSIKVYMTRLFASLFLMMNVVSLKSQTSDVFSVELKWNGIEKVEFYGDVVSRVSFDDAFYDDIHDISPIYRKIIPVYDANVAADFDVKIKKAEKLTAEELLLVGNDIDSIPYYNYTYFTSRDNSSLCFTLFPFFKKDDDVMRIVSCDVSYSLMEKRRQTPMSYVENSVLASGDWYMMSVTSAGMYKLTYSQLAEMGVPVSGLNPKNIRLYHNGGGVLPMSNNSERHQDLVEIPIYVYGENDNIFDENDYVVFYARGPLTWKYNDGIYERIPNPYSDYAYVFLTTDLGEGKRIQYAEVINSDDAELVSSFLDYQLKEVDEYNINNMGASWFFDKFDAELSKSYTFNFPNIIKTENCIMVSEAASDNTTAAASFKYKANGNFLTQINFNKVTSVYEYAKVVNTGKISFYSAKDEVSIGLDYIRSGSSDVAWLDYIIINAWRELKFSGDVMAFRNPRCVPDEVYRYEIRNASSALQVWNVTDPVNPVKMPLQYLSDKVTFNVKGEENSEFIAFDGNEYKSPVFVSKVANQNLHSQYDIDYLIITYPDFYSQAQRVKDIHARIDDLEINIVTPQQIYNEFSCGALDVAAIRDYIKMIYDKSEKRLKYVLLFGDASYDFRNKSGNVCFIPSYESLHSTSSSSNVTDDFYAFLDDSEGEMQKDKASQVVDIAVGRMPVGTIEDAAVVVDKIEAYLSKDKENMGEWRKLITFVTDDEYSFMSNAEQLQSLVEKSVGNAVNFDKIYLDAFPQVATSSGQRSPECNAAITNRVETGSLIINYIGHAGEVGWADERILMNEDINSWRNSPKLNLMIAASCEFSRFDDHTRTSAGEYVFLNPYGGAIAMITAARVTYGSNNQNMFREFYKHLFDIEGGNYLTMGDLYVCAKQIGDENSKDYSFFGDPALRLNYPINNVELTSINGHDASRGDTLRALQSSNIKGMVKDVYGNKMSDFNGTLQLSIYDKENSYTTQGDQQDAFSFKLRDNVIYTGKVPVVNGEFSADFTLPKDINYSYGKGLISFYAFGESDDAQGCYSDIIVGSMNPDAEPDETAPEIELFIDDIKFVDGSMTNENPLLIARLRDTNGINTSSAAIGHDITATLSGATNKTYSLNQFYDAPLSEDDFGTVSYKFYNLNEGEHTLTFRAWDIYNNSSTATISFKVVKGKVIEIENVTNYPNPMSDNTSFTFEHNQKDNEIDVNIRIYDVMGQLVSTITERRYGTTARIEPIRWDGTSDNGRKLPSGLYVYYVTITNSQKEESSGYSKLIIQ